MGHTHVFQRLKEIHVAHTIQGHMGQMVHAAHGEKRVALERLQRFMRRWGGAPKAPQRIMAERHKTGRCRFSGSASLQRVRVQWRGAAPKRQ